MKTKNLQSSPKKDYIESVAVGVVLTAVSYLIGAEFGWISLTDLNWLEVFAVLTSYTCTYLCVKERRINYPLGAISSAAYAVLFWQSGLFASVILNAYLVPTLIYGWIRWGKDTNARVVTHVSLKMVPVYLLVAGVGYLGASVLSNAIGGNMAWTDGLILAGTILAQFLLDNKKLENWGVWALVNVFAIYTYYTTGLFLVAAQYVLFLGNTLYGYLVWKKSLNEGVCLDDSDAPYDRTLAINTVR